MREIIFHLDDSKNFRGGERQVIYLAGALSKRGIRNYIVARKNSPLEEKAQLKIIPNFSLPYFFEWDIISAILLCRKVRRICGKENIPVLHAHTGHTPAVAVLASFFLKCPVIVHRRVDFHLNRNPLTRLKYSGASKIIALSNAIKSILTDYGIDESKIIVIPSAFELNNAASAKSMREELNRKFLIPPDAFLAGTLAALQPHKDPFNLIKAAEICLKQDRNIFFLWAGEGPLKKECEHEAERLGIADSFKFIGQIEENISFLKALDIFILPSKEEGLGSSIIEAMACGLPVAATKAGGITELVKDGINGLLAQKENPVQLAEAVMKIRKDSELRKKFSASSLELSKDFSIDKMAEKTLKVYEETLKNFKPD